MVQSGDTVTLHQADGATLDAEVVVVWASDETPMLDLLPSGGTVLDSVPHEEDAPDGAPYWTAKE
jgi:hypothetical protein